VGCRPEQTVLHQTLTAHWAGFMERAQEQGGLPRFVEKEVEEYLRCGILRYGLLAVVCSRCGFERLVAFSCKRRGFCPSCVGRRMNDAALHLVERVLPSVPIRQWVLSLPYRLRYVLGYDRALCTAVLGAWHSALSHCYRLRAKHSLDLRSANQAMTGAVSFVQRFDSAIRLNVHVHTLGLDGVYVRDERTGELARAPPPPVGSAQLTLRLSRPFAR